MVFVLSVYRYVVVTGDRRSKTAQVGSTGVRQEIAILNDVIADARDEQYLLRIGKLLSDFPFRSGQGEFRQDQPMNDSDLCLGLLPNGFEPLRQRNLVCPDRFVSERAALSPGVIIVGFDT